MSFGEKLKSCRKNMRLNQKEFGQKIGVAESTVSLYESNKNGHPTLLDGHFYTFVLGGECIYSYNHYSFYFGSRQIS